MADGELDGGGRLLVRDRAPEAAPAPVGRGHHDRGERDEHQEAEPEHGDAEAESRHPGERSLPGGPAAPGRRRPGTATGDCVSRRLAGGGDRLGHDAVLLVEELVATGRSQLSKSSATVSRCETAGNGSAGSLAPSTSPYSTPSMIGRKPFRANWRWPSALRTKSSHSLALGCGVDQHGARVLDLHRGLGDDVVEPLAALAGQDRLVLVGHEHVARPADEGGGGVAAAAGQGDHVGEEAVEVGVGLVLGAAVGRPPGPRPPGAFQRAAPDEAGLGVTISTPGFTRSSQVWMFLGLPCPDAEHDDRRRDDALVRTVVPVFGHQALVDQAGDVARHREVDVVGVEAGDDRPALVAGRPVGRLEGDVLALRASWPTRRRWPCWPPRARRSRRWRSSPLRTTSCRRRTSRRLLRTPRPPAGWRRRLR